MSSKKINIGIRPSFLPSLMINDASIVNETYSKEYMMSQTVKRIDNKLFVQFRINSTQKQQRSYLSRDASPNKKVDDCKVRNQKPRSISRNIKRIIENSLDNDNNQIKQTAKLNSIRGLSKTKILQQTFEIGDNSKQEDVINKEVEFINKVTQSFMNTQTFRKLSIPKIQKRSKIIRNLDELFLTQYLRNCSGSPSITLQCKQESGDRVQLISKSNFLEGHQVTQYYRTKMIDWMIIVMQNFEKSSIETIFHAISIMDFMFHSKQQQGICLNLDGLHLLGLTSIFVSSKIYDVHAIQLDSLIKDAGHSKFTKQQVIDSELEILKSTNYNVRFQNVMENSQIILKKTLLEFSSLKLSTIQYKELLNYLEFICLALIHKLCYSLVQPDLLAACAIIVALQLKADDLERKQAKKFSNSPMKNEMRYTYLKLDNDCIYSQILKKFIENQQITDANIYLKILIPRMIGFIQKVQTNKFKFKAMMKYFPVSMIDLLQIDKPASPIQKEI